MKRKLSLLLAAALAISTSFTARSATTADLIFVVDESGSMGGEHAWLGSMVSSLDSALVTAGVTGNTYSLVGFGNGSGGNFGAGNLGRTLLNAGTAGQFATATGSLQLTGGFEDGYSGINYALSAISTRSGAALNVILVTDEDRDNGNNALTFTSIKNAINTRGGLLNGVLNLSLNGGTAIGHADNPLSPNVGPATVAYFPNGTGGFTTAAATTAVGAGTTIADYYNLALQTGGSGVSGAAWDLNKLRAGGNTAASFTAAFVDAKVQEIIIQPGVPDGGMTFLLIGIGFAAVLGLRRRLLV
jgi:hypothetical protein